MKISTGKKEKPVQLIIYGVEGIGKTTFASKFPDPLFIDTEGSTDLYEVKRFDERPSSWPMLKNQVKYVYDHPDICKTLVIDSLDWAELLAKEYLSKKRGWSSIADPGYGQGYMELEKEFGSFLNQLSEVRNQGIHIVCTAHTQTKTFERPGEVGNYDRWELKLEKKVAAVVKQWADVLIFANYETYITNKDKSGKGVATGGARKMYLNHRPAFDAKNRWGLQEDSYDFDYAIIQPFLYEKKGKTKEAPKKEETNVLEEHKEDFQKLHDTASVEEIMKEAEEKKKEEEKDPVDPRLRQLMEAEGITLDEVMESIALRGYYPRGTRYEDLDPDFVEGVLIGAWDNGLLDYIKQVKTKTHIEF